MSPSRYSVSSIAALLWGSIAEHVGLCCCRSANIVLCKCRNGCEDANCDGWYYLLYLLECFVVDIVNIYLYTKTRAKVNRIQNYLVWVIISTRPELSISIFPKRLRTLWPNSNGAFWFLTTEALTLLSSKSPKETFLRLIIVPTFISPLAFTYRWLPTTSFLPR